jgi:uncharacterized protein YktA (UPF0223 family)
MFRMNDISSVIHLNKRGVKVIMDYQYPIDFEWSKEEVVDVISFFQAVEKAYEKGINSKELMDKYKRFKEIVPGKSEEKQLCNEFEEESGYSSYHAVKEAKELDNDKKVKMKKAPK